MPYYKNYFLIIFYIFATVNAGVCQVQSQSNDNEIVIDPGRFINQIHSFDRNKFTFEINITGEKYGFTATENDIIDKELRRTYPDIYSFDIVSNNNANTFGTMTISPSGVYITVKQNGKLICIFPNQSKAVKNLHTVDFGNNSESVKNLSTYCGTDHTKHNAERPFFKKINGGRSDISIGERLYDYRMAVAVTGEFYTSNGNNDTDVIAVVVSSVNSLNVIFRNELSYKFTLGNRVFLHKDPNTDPFTPDKAGGEDRATQAGKIIPTLINSNNFDIGHVFHTHKQNDNWSTGGIAWLNSVCVNSVFTNQMAKASGWSGSFTNSGIHWINLLAHEIGHQFGATHTFNGSGGGCTDNISAGTAVEIGSGSTIMSYNGICDAQQNLPTITAADNYFNIISLEQMYKYVYEGQGGNCGGPTSNLNRIPQVVANPCSANLRLPKNTRFYLKAKGTWTDNDQHTYCWEQTDEDGSGISPTQGQVGNAAANSLKSPLFRSFPPRAEAHRYFPALDILNSASGNSPFEVLPNVARQINFNVSIRDNNASGGTVANDDLTLNVAESGPLTLTRPAGGESLVAGQTEMITWNTNGSDTLCNKTRLKLSIDGGKTYPTIIAENVSYAAGTFQFSIPQNYVQASNAKIMIECMDYECFTFFDISDKTFRINSSCAPAESMLCRSDSLVADKGSSLLNLNLPQITGRQITAITKTIATNNPLGNVSVFTNDFKNCKTVAQNYYYQKAKIVVSETGTYNFKIAGDGFVSIFSPIYEPRNGCTGFIASSARESIIPNNINRNASFSVELRTCTEYEFVFYSFAQLPVTFDLIYESGPGIVFEVESGLANNYQHIFVLVDKVSGNIIKADNNSDLRTINAGTYTLYSTIVPTSTNISSLINRKWTELLQTNCVSRILTQRAITILPTCEIRSISAGPQTACVPSTNRYTQSITVTYSNPPASGKLNINGQTFDITSSPQTVILTNLDSDNKPVSVTAFFTAEESCTLRQDNVFTAPLECCPIPLDLGPTVYKCQQSGTVKLEAGTNETFQYRWSKDGLPINTSQGGVLFVTTTGLYGVQVTHPNGCSKTDTVSVIFNPLPTVTLRDGQSFCENEKYILQATTVPADTIRWFRNDTLISGANSDKIEITKSGKYKIVVKNAFGCENQAQTTVETIKAPRVELGPNLAKCDGDNILLNAGTEGVNYEWYKDNILTSTGPTQSQYSVSNTGLYRVVVTNSNQCKTEDQVKIDFFAAPVIEDFPLTVNGCQGTPLTLDAKVTDYQSLQWYYNNNPISNSNTLKIQANNSGTYSIEAVNIAFCRTRKSTNVDIKSQPVVELGPDLTLCDKTPVLINAGTDGKVYEWSRDNVKLNNPESTLPVLSGGLYSVTVTNQFNCRTVAQKRITYVTGPQVDISKDTSFCDGLNFTIRVNTSAQNARYQWYRNTEPISGSGPTLNVTLPGNYEAWVTAGNPACTTVKTSTITVHPKPAVSLGNDRVLCDPTTFPVLNGGNSNVDFQWSLNGLNISTSRTITADKSGTYALKVRNGFGCERTEQVKITISSNPTLTLSSDTILCEGSTLNISSQSNGTKYLWRRNNVNIPNALSSNYVASMPGLYTLVAANDVDCRTERSITLVSRQKPILELGKDTSICPGANIILSAGNHTSYIWSDGSTESTKLLTAGNPTTNTLTKYVVTVKNQFNCESKDSIIITQYAAVKANITSNTTTICPGDTLTLTASGGQNYKWTGAGINTLSVTNKASTTAKPTTKTLYTVEVTSDACPDLKDIKSIEISLFELTKSDAGRDTCTISGRPINLNATGGVKYIWESTPNISGATNIANPTVIASSDAIYRVTITDSNGCISVDSVNVCIKAAEVTAINVLTPNNDGKNDELIFPGLADHPGNKLTIFNRWGNVVFEAEDYQIVGILFTGERNGERLPPDTYYYILKYDKKVVKSALTILWD